MKILDLLPDILSKILDVLPFKEGVRHLIAIGLMFVAGGLGATGVVTAEVATSLEIAFATAAGYYIGVHK